MHTHTCICIIKHKMRTKAMTVCVLTRNKMSIKMKKRYEDFFSFQRGLVPNKCLSLVPPVRALLLSNKLSVGFRTTIESRPDLIPS